MSRSRISWYVLALALPVAACSSDDDSSSVNLFDGYPNGSITVPARLAVADQSPVGAIATVTSYEISPSLPMGMTFDAMTGVIGGTPIDVAAAQAYVVTATDGTDSDAESITIAVRNPIVGLTTDRAVTVVENVAGSPITPAGAGVGVTGTAPAATIATLTELTVPELSDSAAVTATDASNQSTDPVLDANNATADFTATITIADSELDPGDTWDFAAQAPYDDDGLVPALPSFAFDTSTVVVEDGALTLDVSFDDGTTMIGPFDSGSIATSVREVEPLTATAPFVGFSWTALGEDFYTTVQDGAFNTEVFRFDADGDVGGGPALTEAFDLDDAVDGEAQIQGVVAGHLIVEMAEPTMGFTKTYAYNPGTDVLAQVADLNPAGFDTNMSYTELDGALYFSGRNAMGEDSLYRYTFDDGVNAAVLERVSSTAEGSPEDEPEDLVVFAGDLLFTALDDMGNRNLYSFDPDTDTQAQLSDNALAPVGNLVVDGGALYATAATAMGGEKLHLWNPTDSALQQVSDLTGDDALDDSASPRLAFNGQFYFVGDDGVSGSKLYRHNPAVMPFTVEQMSNTAGTGNDDAPSQMTPIGSLLFFVSLNATGNDKLYVLDGNSGVITQVTNVNADTVGDSISGLTPIGTTRLAFSAGFGGTDSELYTYDLNTGETLRAADVNPGTSDFAFPIVEFGGRVVFRADNGSGSAFYAAD